MKKKILIVEDEAIVAADVRQILLKNGYNVTGIADSERKALELFNNNKTDLVICDINLGKGGSGIEVARYIKKTTKIPVIFLTAYSNDTMLEQAFGTKPAFYLTKPFRDEQLIVTVKQVFISYEEDNAGKAAEKPTPREMEILKLVARGLTSHKIAAELNISFETVQTHRKNLLGKYKLKSSAELIAFGVKRGWIEG